MAVRLAVEPSGCSGFGYRIDPTDSIRKGDRVFENDGVRVAVDALSLPYLQGATVDLVQEGLARAAALRQPERAPVLRLRGELQHVSVHATEKRRRSHW